MSLRNDAFRWLPAVAWAALLLWLGTRPPGGLPETGPRLDKLAHACFYGVLGLLAARASGRVTVAALAGLVIGGLDEWLQSGVGRDADALDLAADLLGAALGGWIYMRTPWARRRSRN